MATQAWHPVLCPYLHLSVPWYLLDPLRVKQILVNGLTNALKHTVSGSVTLQVCRL
jgi:hypothetical protein